MTKPAHSPTLVVCRDDQHASETVAKMFADLIRTQADAVLGLATGGTPVPAYRELVRMHREEALDFSDVVSFNLDEYVGLAPDHPQSFRYFMQEHLFDHINIAPANTHVPDGLSNDSDEHGRGYEKKIAEAGGIELQLLGIGHNGHIAFNEPGSPVDSRTRVVDLAEDTVQANARFFESIEQVPRQGITMGIGTILESRRIVLLATGSGKAEAVQRAIEGPSEPSHPASLLQQHPSVTFVIDDAAASHLA